MEKIKKALEAAKESLDAIGTPQEWDCRPLIDAAISELEGSKPKELTDEEIERIAWRKRPEITDMPGGIDVNESQREVFAEALRYARDHGYLSPQPKEPHRYVMSKDHDALCRHIGSGGIALVKVWCSTPGGRSYPTIFCARMLDGKFSMTQDMETVNVLEDNADGYVARCKEMNLEWIATESPKEIATDEELEGAAMEVVKAAWSKSSMVDGVKLMLDYFRMWRDQGKVTINRTEPPKEQGAEPAPTSREKAMEEAINNANVSIQRLDHRDLDMHKVAMMDVDDWRAIQDAAKSTK